MNRIRMELVIGLCLGAAALAAAPAPDDAALKRRIGHADYYVREFEKEVALQRGGEKMVWRSQRAALEKVRDLKVQYPDDPRVEALFQRVKAALKRSKGDFVDVQAKWTQYLHNEDNLRRLISKLGEEEWARIIESHREGMIAKAFPAPDSAEVSRSSSTARRASSSGAESRPAVFGSSTSRDVTGWARTRRPSAIAVWWTRRCRM